MKENKKTHVLRAYSNRTYCNRIEPSGLYMSGYSVYVRDEHPALNDVCRACQARADDDLIFYQNRKQE